MANGPPVFCLLCGSDRAPRPAGFSQRYLQAEGPPLAVSWWECSKCRGWFAYPVPSIEAIQRNWGSVAYADPHFQPTISEGKQHVIRRILAGMAKRVAPGKLLDVGCSTGLFMLAARKAGWTAFGFDPNIAAVEAAHQHGLDVRLGWSLDQGGYAAGEFDAITAIDVFYYSWNPLNDLRTFYRLLRPDGVLAMRISNKRLALGIARRLTPAGPARDARMSRLLQSQFHAISLGSLRRAMQTAGFDHIRFEPHASTAPFRAMSWTSRTAYLVADAIRLGTLGRVDLSPGVLVYAQKSVSS